MYLGFIFQSRKFVLLSISRFGTVAYQIVHSKTIMNFYRAILCYEKNQNLGNLENQIQFSYTFFYDVFRFNFSVDEIRTSLSLHI